VQAFERFERFTFEAIGRFFGGLKAATIEQQFRLLQQPFRQPDRPPIRTAEVQKWVTQLINDWFHAYQPMTDAEILDLLHYNHTIVLSSESLRHIIQNTPSVKSAMWN
jgi:asparagine synthetase B (glutamine-hydrolysing)